MNLIDKNLLKIANTLVLNQHNIDNMGLLNGKLGIAIFFFHFGRLIQNNTYTEYAEEILDRVINNIGRGRLSFEFEDGISGISWGLDYLIRNAFIEGDINEILEDTDTLMLTFFDAKNHTAIYSDADLFDIGLYFCLRINNTQYKGDDKIASGILSSIETVLEIDKPLKISLLNSILYTVRQIEYFFNFDIAKTSSITNKINERLTKSIDSGIYRNMDLLILKKLYPEGYLHLDEQKKQEDDIHVAINGIWQSLLYDIKEPLCNLNEFHLDKEADKMTMSLLPENLTMKEGVTGLGLGLILNKMIK